MAVKRGLLSALLRLSRFSRIFFLQSLFVLSHRCLPYFYFFVSFSAVSKGIACPLLRLSRLSSLASYGGQATEDERAGESKEFDTLRRAYVFAKATPHRQGERIIIFFQKMESSFLMFKSIN
jgi:hypothetical protein